MALPLPTSLSPSKVSAFKDCALAFRFAAIERLPEPPTASATKGTLVHMALERLLDQPPEARTPETALQLLGEAHAELARHPDFTELELSEAEEAQFVLDAQTLVRRYFELEDPRQVRAIGLELQLEARVGNLLLRGVIDRLELDEDGELVVTDYKTGRPPTELFEHGRLGGVHFYAFLCQEFLGRRPSKVQLLYLSQPLSIVARPSEQSVRGLQQRTLAVWNAVERACEREDFRPRPSRLCEWCSFRQFCPAWGGDPADARQLVAAGA